MVVQKQEEVLINAQGEYLQIIYEYPETLEESQSIVPLSNYYDVLNLERYPTTIWSFDLEKWIGKGEQRPIVIPEPSEFDKIRIESAQANAELFEMMLSMVGGI